jgi:type IV pilus assembly protein PilB
MDLKSANLVEILLKLNYISSDQVDAIKKANPEAEIVKELLAQKILTKDLIGQAISENYKISYFDLTNKDIPKEHLEVISKELSDQYRLIFVDEDKTKVHFTTSLPEKMSFLKEALEKYFPKKKIEITYSLEEDISALLKTTELPFKDKFLQMISAEGVSISDILNEIVEESLKQSASDIHFEPLPDEVNLRLRIDGKLHEIVTFKKDTYTNLINRIKVLAHLRIDEHFAPQDGAIRFVSKDKRVVDLRVSVIPVLDGEKVAIRVLSDYLKSAAFEDLGFNEDQKRMINMASEKSYGMILTTGPTGSGKTTTLYSLIRNLQSSEVNITTIEDPVEYRIPGINQIQVNPAKNITFAKGLRSIVRQDPNVILVGEIRDRETAEIAINAALTGHLLLSTFHANDAATAIPRLLDMEVEPFLLSSTINLIIAQRLARRLCLNCRYSEEVSVSKLPKDVQKSFKTKEVTLYKSKGCEKCNNTGFKGRVGLFEFIYITPEIQELITNQEGVSSQKIWQLAKSQNAISFFEDGMNDVKEGVISLEELIRVAPLDYTKQEFYGKK